MTYIPTSKNYFSGGGGLDLGLMDGGINVIQSLELDPVCCDTLRKNFSHMIVQADIKDVLVLDQEKSDLMAFTYPCTKYSTIGDIKGFRTGDELFLHALRHIAIEKPEGYIVENVPGMRKFKVVMEAMTKLPDYYVNIFCPVDALNWLPQKRERLILIGTRRNFRISPPKRLRRVSLKEILEEEVSIEIPDYVYKRLNGKYRDRPIISNPDDPNAYAPTCVAHYSRDLSTRLVVDKRFKDGIRPYTPREYARLQGFPDSFQFAGTDREIYKQIGNAVPPPMATWVASELLKYFN